MKVWLVTGEWCNPRIFSTKEKAVKAIAAQAREDDPLIVAEWVEAMNEDELEAKMSFEDLIAYCGHFNETIFMSEIEIE